MPLMDLLHLDVCIENNWLEYHVVIVEGVLNETILEELKNIIKIRGKSKKSTLTREISLLTKKPLDYPSLMFFMSMIS